VCAGASVTRAACIPLLHSMGAVIMLSAGGSTGRKSYIISHLTEFVVDNPYSTASGDGTAYGTLLGNYALVP
jgi:hypothetical protein